MVDSNLQRESLLPSERAFAYKMKLEAMKRQAGRPSKENCSQVGNDFGKKSSEVLAEQVGQSKNQIFRYIRLTELIPELMDMVDEKKIALNPAYELSFLKKDEQVDLLDAMDSEQATPSLSTKCAGVVHFLLRRDHQPPEKIFLHRSIPRLFFFTGFLSGKFHSSRNSATPLGSNTFNFSRSKATAEYFP
jgi:hypothetical protein